MSGTYSFTSRDARMLAVLLVGLAAALAVAGVVSAREATAARTVPLERAHAHNDYEHDRPLHDALESGFKSVEADVWLIDGELVVSHDDPRLPTTAEPKGTLESLYLKPLRERVRENGGNVYEGDRDYFTLLVDIKSEAEPTYRALHRELKKHQRMLTTFKRDDVEDGAVTAIVSGNRPREFMEGQRTRYAAYDGRIPDDLGNSPQTFVPLVSQNWTRLFTWQGVGPMPEAEREKLREIVTTAHANGQRVRFWATPEMPDAARDAVWQELIAAEVDYINTDNLDALEAFLLANDPRPTAPHVYWEGGRSGR
ncbi:MAG TPA: phosphatidylinositol-specific phospholipase C/glycerophosphodiester phosphodiesterase family protein [Rubrobacter sp.]|nr:phosphatidylinositol-specific phospholipase C/glycerophosphodiester phosphodiesterase family protein [Rubrobacter sp.]